jgi:hypothetical protein
MQKCTICKQDIVLVPSAAERAKRYGGKASDYTKLFTEHAACVLKKRNDETRALIERTKGEYVNG